MGRRLAKTTSGPGVIRPLMGNDPRAALRQIIEELAEFYSPNYSERGLDYEFRPARSSFTTRSGFETWSNTVVHRGSDRLYAKVNVQVLKPSDDQGFAQQGLRVYFNVIGRDKREADRLSLLERDDFFDYLMSRR